MRCPKCGFISFDHMETCRKCKKDISGSTEVEGTTYHAEAPSFLRVPQKNGSESVEEGAVDMGEDFADTDHSFTDPDLDALVGEDFVEEEDDDDDEGGTISFGGSDSSDFELESDDESDEDGSFEFDLDEDLDFSDDQETASPALDVPDALADISDLAPPAADKSPTASLSDEMNLSLDDEMNLDENLDLDGLDLDLGLSGGDTVTDGDVLLSLDDIELSSGDVTDESLDLDGLDMDMDFDLGGVDDSPAPKKEESSGSLDGVSLSLD